MPRRCTTAFRRLFSASTLLGLLLLCDVVYSYQCWAKWDRLTTPRGDSCSALVMQTAYLIGGATGTSAEASSSTVSISVDNPLQWELSEPNLPLPMQGRFCTFNDETMYVSPDADSSAVHVLTRPRLFLYVKHASGSPWRQLPPPRTQRRLFALASVTSPSYAFIVGGLGADDKPTREVDIFNASANAWVPSITMPIGGCLCHTVGRGAEVIIACADCSQVVNQSWAPGSGPPITYSVIRLDARALSFSPKIWNFTVPATMVSFSSQVMGHFVVHMVSFVNKVNPVMYYTDLFTGRTLEVQTKYITESRHCGGLVPMTSQLMYAGGITPGGSASREVDLIPVLPSVTVSLNYINRTYYVGQDVIAKTLACTPGLMLRLAKTPSCDENVPGTIDTKCTPSTVQSYTFIHTTLPAENAFLCASLGVCGAELSKRLPCNNTAQGTNNNFENCLFNACCWDDTLQQCYAFTGGPSKERYFFSVDTDPVVIISGNHEPAQRHQGWVHFFSSPGGIAAVVCSSLMVLVVLSIVVARGIRGANRDDDEAGSLHPLDQHSRYKVLCKLGQGGFGTVFLVSRKSDGVKFALKYIICKDEEERNYAIKEFELIRSAQGHPNMVTMVDMFMNWSENTEVASPLRRADADDSGSIQSDALIAKYGSGDNKKKKKKASSTDSKNSISEVSPLLQLAPKYVCIVMQYCPEGDLCQFIRRQRMAGHLISERLILNIFAKQCCSLLKHLHSLDPPLVHRDLKPENVLLADNGERIVVTDFGLAQYVEQSYMTTRAGSLNYVAPECWKRHYTTAVDNWAVGCIIYGACTGRVTSDSARVMFNDVRDPSFSNEIEDELQDYSPKLRRIVLGLLQADPRKRWTSEQVLAEIEASA